MASHSLETNPSAARIAVLTAVAGVLIDSPMRAYRDAGCPERRAALIGMASHLDDPCFEKVAEHLVPGHSSGGDVVSPASRDAQERAFT
jgi:hypothetical protein